MMCNRKYNLDELKIIFSNYAKENTKISDVELEKYSNIPIHIWRYYKDELLECIDNKTYFYICINKYQNLISSIIENSRLRKNKTKLIHMFSGYDEIIKKIIIYANKYNKKLQEVQKLQKEIRKYELEIDELKTLNLAYEHRMKRYRNR